MCEVVEYLDDEEEIFRSPSSRNSSTDEGELEEPDDSNSSVSETECALALLKLAQSFVIMSSFDHLASFAANQTAEHLPVTGLFDHDRHMLNDHSLDLNRPSPSAAPSTQEPAKCKPLVFSASHDIRCITYSQRPNFAVIELDHSYAKRCAYNNVKLSSVNSRRNKRICKIRTNKQNMKLAGNKTPLRFANEMFDRANSTTVA